MVSAPVWSVPGRMSWAVGAGINRGEHALSASFTHRLTTDKPFAVVGGVSFSGDEASARVAFIGEL